VPSVMMRADAAAFCSPAVNIASDILTPARRHVTLGAEFIGAHRDPVAQFETADPKSA